MPQLGDVLNASKLEYKGTASYIWVACLDCGKERWVVFRNGKAQNKRCRHCAMRKNFTPHWGCKSPLWKGGRYKTKVGYILIRLYPSNFFYPMANKVGYVFEHRLIMAQHLGRCLLTWEIVHHKNSIRDDNRLENLQLFPAQYKHYALTRMRTYIKKLEREVDRLQGQV